MQVDGRVGLAGRRVQGGGGTKDMLVGEVLHHVCLFQRGNNAGLGARAHDRHWVYALLPELLELFWHTLTWLALLFELRCDGAQFFVDILIELLGVHCEVVLLLQTDHHAAEVLADKAFEEAVGGVAMRDAIFLEELVGQVAASFEGEFLGQAERVVAVEEDVLDLRLRQPNLPQLLE